MGIQAQLQLESGVLPITSDSGQFLAVDANYWNSERQDHDKVPGLDFPLCKSHF
jgi:hypothetical protein